MNRVAPLILAAGFALASSNGFAQTAAPAPETPQVLPAGHPSVGAAPAAGAPAAPPQQEQDALFTSPEVPVGSIHVKLVNETGEPLANADVTLGVQFQKISEGEQHTERHAQTDANGIARFAGLTLGGDFSYRASAKNGPAVYGSDPIQLKGDSGVLALLHVYPVTRSLEKASIGARGFIYVETRDDVFQFEILYRYFNMGTVTWVPEDARLSLPTGFKAFKAGEATSDARFEEDPGHGVKLAGTFAPGQHDVSFRFQVPRHEESSASFRFALPPRTAEIRFLAEAAPSMQLDIDNFEKPRIDVNNGQRILVTRRVAKAGEPALGAFTAQLSGIPTPGSGRWIAALIAAALAGLGFAVFRGSVGEQAQSDLQERDAERARRVLLDEVVDLTRARREERIGPGTFESARRALVEALARIVSQNPGLGQKPKKTPAGKRSKKGAKAARA